MDIELLGYIAAILTTSSFIPQVVKTIKTKDTSGISLYMYLFFVFGVGLWFVYGIRINSMPIIIANLLTGLMSIVILYYKIRESSSDKSKSI